MSCFGRWHVAFGNGVHPRVCARRSGACSRLASRASARGLSACQAHGAAVGADRARGAGVVDARAVGARRPGRARAGRLYDSRAFKTVWAEPATGIRCSLPRRISLSSGWAWRSNESSDIPTEIAALVGSARLGGCSGARCSSPESHPSRRGRDRSPRARGSRCSTARDHRRRDDGACGPRDVPRQGTGRQRSRRLRRTVSLTLSNRAEIVS